MSSSIHDSGVVYSQTLSQAELKEKYKLAKPYLTSNYYSQVDSAIWITQQYRFATIAPTQAGICGSSIFTCVQLPSGFHITTIAFSGGGSGAIVQPNPTLVFSFPELTMFANNVVGVANVNLNILDRLRDLPKLQKLYLNYDQTAKSMPADFAEHLPSLIDFRELLCPLTTIDPLFNNSILQTLQAGPLTHLTIDPSLNLSKLATLTLTVNPSVPQTYIITQNSFPMLREVVLNGFASTITPSLDQLIGLESLTIKNSSMTVFPFDTYPPQLRYLDISYSLLTSFPTIPLAPKMTHLVLQNTKIQGEVPWTLFQNKILFDLDIQDNIGIIGTVPQSYCPNKINMMRTSISNVPVIAYESTNLILRDKSGVVRGYPMGWGGLFSGSVSYWLDMIGMNEFIFSISSPNPIYGIVTPFTFQVDFYYPAYQFPFTYLETKFSLVDATVVQVPNGVYQLKLAHVENIEASLPYLNYTILLNGTIPCQVTSVVGKNITCNSASIISEGQLKVFNSNNYSNSTVTISVGDLYPVITTQPSTTVYAEIGTQLDFEGVFGPNPNLAIIYINGNNSICINTGTSTSTKISCNVELNFIGGLTNVTILADGFPSTPYFVNYDTPQTKCPQLTNNCSNHGTCNIDGQCQCNIGYYSNDCSIGYPVLSSGTYDKQNNKLICLFGNFGPYNQANVSVLVNSTLDCVVTYKSQYNINCTLGSNPTAGLVSFQIQVDNLTGSAKDLFYIPLPNNGTNGGTTTSSTTGGGETAQEKCQRETSNCYGHGKCDVNGVCQCELNYQPLDNCLTKIINNTIQPNNTSPTPAFNIDGVTFLFEVVAIQEIGIDNELIFELLTNKWNSNITNSSDTTIAVYSLNHTLGNTTIITSTISFSSKPRDIQFGSKVLHINPNSIKLSVNVTGWKYASILSTLRVIFKTTINNNQTIEFDCKDIPIDTLTFDQMSSSLQYLRVIKDNIQFTGRFIDYVLSDGREAFSRTYLINQTSVQGDKQSNILLGISMPQCQSCVLDPDFSPLIVDKSNDSGCDSKSNTWRIVVGVVVGGVALLAISAASVFFYRKKWIHHRQEISMSNRLGSMRD
ncbi:hypothetical protein DFA_09623 [Cavenderia fasciculata]|uniref:EGF-like domain-containing protein n=1 Tax=Cavenderia fasciculata TaxID=261658 RepID=F4Q852_CACFS|nr:uncharacterized protein DFA_09623 [Cavenderia fasciculata]EGG15952.1 hypothetical protein DFA_09623 [Cavenderia fasciculata]|eukprot:XP_004352277.1 hypothetical protein DFA_09623 [Cavenderia fasciculata]